MVVWPTERGAHFGALGQSSSVEASRDFRGRFVLMPDKGRSALAAKPFLGYYWPTLPRHAAKLHSAVAGILNMVAAIAQLFRSVR